MKTVAIIPARGGSIGIPKKNILPFCGKPLIFWSIAAARRCRSIERVFVSTDSAEIAEISCVAGAEVIVRPEEIATGTSQSELALFHACDYIRDKYGLRPERVVFLQATSPIRDPAELTEALAQFEREKLDSLLSVSTRDHAFWWITSADKAKPLNYDPCKRPMRQDRGVEDIYAFETGSFYITNTEKLFETGSRLCGKIGTYTVPMWKGLELDTPQEVRFLENIMRFHGLDKTLLAEGD